jgi:uncharacterized protein YutE (UPF0331/DUF86 family)
LLVDFDLQDFVPLNLSRTVQLSVDIITHFIAEMDILPPSTMGQKFDLLALQSVLSPVLAGQLKKFVGFRNVAGHNYEIINWLIVQSIFKNQLSEFSEYTISIVQPLPT